MMIMQSKFADPYIAYGSISYYKDRHKRNIIDTPLVTRTPFAQTEDQPRGDRKVISFETDFDKCNGSEWKPRLPGPKPESVILENRLRSKERESSLGGHSSAEKRPAPAHSSNEISSPNVKRDKEFRVLTGSKALTSPMGEIHGGSPASAHAASASSAKPVKAPAAADKKPKKWKKRAREVDDFCASRKSTKRSPIEVQDYWSDSSS